MSEVDGATLMARSLKQQGIDHLFGVVGFPIGPIAAAAQKEGVAYIGMRNEQAASYAARAYGYLTGRPGACVVVTGPGVVHGLAGLADAQQNCWPMILIGGASETYRGGMGAFQEERQVLIASPFCKFAHGVEAWRAFRITSRWQRGMRSMGVRVPATSTCRTTSSRASATSTRPRRSSACPSRRA
jgi:2-hydroxyacyl-CoA lyase 1